MLIIYSHLHKLPKKWFLSPQLETNREGKWERKRWLEWAQKKDCEIY